MAKPAAPDPKVAHLPPPQVAAYAALGANRVVAAAGPANFGRGLAAAPPAPAKPRARKQAAAKAAADARVQARLDADAARRRQREDAARREQEELARLRAETDKLRAELDRKRAQRRADAAAEARAAMDAQRSRQSNNGWTPFGTDMLACRLAPLARDRLPSINGTS
jgi:hypothetical protein